MSIIWECNGQFEDATIEVNMIQYVEGLEVYQISTNNPEKEILSETRIQSEDLVNEPVMSTRLG